MKGEHLRSSASMGRRDVLSKDAGDCRESDPSEDEHDSTVNELAEERIAVDGDRCRAEVVHYWRIALFVFEGRGFFSRAGRKHFLRYTLDKRLAPLDHFPGCHIGILFRAGDRKPALFLPLVDHDIFDCTSFFDAKTLALEHGSLLCLGQQDACIMPFFCQVRNDCVAWKIKNP